jgi:hypothetical protein
MWLLSSCSREFGCAQQAGEVFSSSPSRSNWMSLVVDSLMHYAVLLPH